MERLNYILAYKRDTAIKLVLSTEEAVYNANTENQTPYTPTHRLDRDENEWFYIENFSKSDLNTPIAKIGGIDLKIEELFKRPAELLQSGAYQSKMTQGF